MTSPAPEARGDTSRGLLSWAMYDWAASAHSAVIQTFIFAAYFTRRVAEDETQGSAAWGHTLGIVGLVIAVTAPVLGAISDRLGRRKPWIFGFTLLCVLATGFLFTVAPAPDRVWPALVLVGLSSFGIEYATVFYNAMLGDLAPAERIGRWSGWGWGLGYVGGLASLLVALWIMSAGWSESSLAAALHVRSTFLLTAAWYLVFSLPLFLWTPDAPPSGCSMGTAVREGWASLRSTLGELRHHPEVLRFLIAHMAYTDALVTVFAFGGVYAAGTFDMTEKEILGFGIALNVTAGLGALVFAKLDDRIGSRTVILISLGALIATMVGALAARTATQFWVAGSLLGLFVGPLQASSRSYLARLAPAGLRTQMFGLYALSGKATSFLGPLLVGWVTLHFSSQRAGMSTLLFGFLAGLVLMLGTAPPRPGSAG